MEAMSSEMGLFEGHQEARVFTHSIELLRRDQYSLAGKLMAWSLANGGPGLGCLSSYMYDLWCGSAIVHLEDAAKHVYDNTCQCLIKEVGLKAFYFTVVNLPFQSIFLSFSFLRC